MDTPWDSDGRHFYTPSILTWPYWVIMSLENSDIEFCNESDHRPWELLCQSMTYGGNSDIFLHQNPWGLSIPHPQVLYKLYVILLFVSTSQISGIIKFKIWSWHYWVLLITSIQKCEHCILINNLWLLPVLQGDAVEPEHCLIEHDSLHVTIIPMGKALCTVNGTVIQEPYKLTQGMWHLFKCYSFQFVLITSFWKWT